MIDRLKVSGVLETYLIGDYQHEFNQEINGNCPMFFETVPMTLMRLWIRHPSLHLLHWLGLDKFYCAQEKAYPFAIGVPKRARRPSQTARPSLTKRSRESIAIGQ